MSWTWKEEEVAEAIIISNMTAFHENTRKPEPLLVRNALEKKRYLCFTTTFSSKCFGESLHYIEGAFDAFAVLWTGVSIRPLHTKPVNLNK